MIIIFAVILAVGLATHFLITGKLKAALQKSTEELVEERQKKIFSDGQVKVLEQTLEETKKQSEFRAENIKQTESQLTAIESKYDPLLSRKQELESENENLKKSVKDLDGKLREELNKTLSLTKDKEHLTTAKTDAEDISSQKISDLEDELESLRTEKETLARELAAIREQEPIRISKYDERVARLNESQANLEKDRERDRLSREQSEIDRLAMMQETWARHEQDVEQKMRLICQELSIDYVDKENFPFTGKPDNSVKICDEFVVFDGKSPLGDDLSNFPAYIRTQAEQAKKYTKHDEVKKDLFFVVPTNAIQALSNTFIALGTYRVHVVTLDSLRPILMQLKRIEDYEFAEKLSPEDREKIVTTLGKMAHGMKRRVQIDQFFSNEFIAILTDAENLPAEILEGARIVERSSKLNPTIHTRAKRIEITALQKESEKLAGRVAGQEIHTGPELKAIEALPLYSGTDGDQE